MNHIVITKTENHKYLVHYNNPRIGGPIITGETKIEALLEFKQALKVLITVCLLMNKDVSIYVETLKALKII